MQIGSALGQRVWKRQPRGRLSGLGGSPGSDGVRCRLPGCSFGTAPAAPGYRDDSAAQKSSSVSAELDDRAQVHDRHPLADVAHHGQIVGHEQDRQSEIALKLAKQVENLDLNRDVQLGHRLVRDQKRRRRGQRPRDPDALLLPPAERSRVTLAGRRG